MEDCKGKKGWTKFRGGDRVPKPHELKVNEFDNTILECKNCDYFKVVKVCIK